MVTLAVLVLSACASRGVQTGTGAADNAASPAYVPQPGLSDKERFRQVLYLLEAGEPGPARTELELYLEQQPKSAVARDLLEQIDLPAASYFPEEYREVQLQPGWSLSTVSQHYLGSVFQFHALAKYNGIAKPRKLTAGQTIRVPLTATASQAFAAQDQAAMTATMGAEPEGGNREVPVAGAPSSDDAAVEGITATEDIPAVDTVVTPVSSDPSILLSPSPSRGSSAETPAPGSSTTVVVDAGEVERLHREALNAYRAQDLDKAIELWDQVLVLDPEYESARLYRSQAIELKRKLSNLI